MSAWINTMLRLRSLCRKDTYNDTFVENARTVFIKRGASRGLSGELAETLWSLPDHMPASSALHRLCQPVGLPWAREGDAGGKRWVFPSAERTPRMGKGRLRRTSGDIRGGWTLSAPNESPAFPHSQVPPTLVSIFPEAFNPSDSAPLSSGLFWSSLSSLPPLGSPEFSDVLSSGFGRWRG